MQNKRTSNTTAASTSGKEHVACPRCGGPLYSDDIALYRKLRDHTADISDCCCRYCLAAHFRCPPALMDEKIRQFKESGCTLFGLKSQK